MATRARQRLALILAGVLGVLPGAVAARADIVFLLPQPGRGEPAFFELAAAHYRQQPGVALVVDSARSLLQVRELLQRSSLRGDEPWGRIVLVAHGSRWTGLGLPIFDDSGLPAPGDWRAVRERGEFMPLDSTVVDARTRLQIDSCGLGARPDLLRELAWLLGGGQPFAVTASPGLVEFVGDPGNPTMPVLRRERPYAAKIRPRTTAMSAARTDRQGRRHLPVEFQQRLPLSRDCTKAALPGLLRGAAPMARALRDHGLRPRDLHFDLRERAGVCRLRGRGVLIVEANSNSWPMTPLAAEVP